MRKNNKTKKPLNLDTQTIKTLDALTGVAGGGVTIGVGCLSGGASCHKTGCCPW